MLSANFVRKREVSPVPFERPNREECIFEVFMDIHCQNRMRYFLSYQLDPLTTIRPCLNSVILIANAWVFQCIWRLLIIRWSAHRRSAVRSPMHAFKVHYLDIWQSVARQYEQRDACAGKVQPLRRSISSGHWSSNSDPVSPYPISHSIRISGIIESDRYRLTSAPFAME